jgi:hypothetical protein
MPIIGQFDVIFAKGHLSFGRLGSCKAYPADLGISLPRPCACTFRTVSAQCLREFAIPCIRDYFRLPGSLK